MHLAFVCEEYPPAPHGGTGSSYRDLAEGLVAAGHAATVVGISTTEPFEKRREESHNGVRGVRLPRAPTWLGTRLRGRMERRRLLRTLRRLHAASPFTALECSDYNGWLSCGGIAGIPLIVRIRGSNLFFDTELQRPPQIYEHGQERACLAQATHLASVSRYAADRTLALCGTPERNCTIIPNGVDAEIFSPSSKVQPGLIVFVNSLNPKKGIEQLLDAANAVFPKRRDARLVVIGEDTRSPANSTYLDQLRARVGPEIRHRIEFTGRLGREEIVEWLRRAAIACYPSHMETFGIAALEAMSVGRPTIFTRLGPGPEIVDDNVTGLLCDPHDPISIAYCLTRLLDDPTYAESLGTAARARVLAHFDKRHWIPRNVAFYTSCTERR